MSSRIAASASFGSMRIGRVGPDEDAAAEPLRDLAEKVPAGEERVELLRVEDDVRALELDVGDLDILRQDLPEGLACLLNERVETHP